MSRTLELDPFTIAILDDAVRICFSEPVSNVLEIPPSFENQLRDLVEGHRPELSGKPIHIDLDNVPALSSRQLGMILTVREVMKTFGKLELQNMSDSVKHLLRLTGTERFFEENG